MNKILKLFMIAVATVTAIPSFAVSDKEMEAARALAAKHYLRYTNNGSDYLDKLEPKSMAELNAALKTKEKENIKAFNAVAVPKDYASWDKDRLVEYWSSTFFKQPGLADDGKKCLGVLRTKLGKLTVAVPAAKAEPKAETPSQPETKPEDTAPKAPQQEPAAAAETSAPVSAAAAEMQADSLAAIADADAGVAEETPRKSSHTGWYIAILVVLVAVVVWLVVYAARTMKGADVPLLSREDTDREVREAKRQAKEEQTSMREKYAASVATKNDEIKQLKARCQDLETQLEAALREAEKARRQAAAAQQQLQTALLQQTRQAAAQEPVAEPKAPVQSNYKSSASSQPGLPPLVWMGVVNQRGLFTKASRSINPDSSVYRMTIPDGHHGTFMVATDHNVVDRVLADPEKWLAGGCVIENPEDADIAAEIVTTAAGEALFADNTCRVTKKAHVKFL